MTSVSSDLIYKPSAETLAALDALTVLRRKEGVMQVGRAASECVKEQIMQNYIKHYHLKESRSSDMCLCRLLGKRCPYRTGGSTYDCINFAPGVVDHPSYWNRNGKPFVFISQPYKVSLENMKSMVEIAEKHKLDVRITNYSWYYPTGTLFIEVHREGWTNELRDMKD